MALNLFITAESYSSKGALSTRYRLRSAGPDSNSGALYLITQAPTNV